MHTYASAELANDADAMRAIGSAEEASGFRTGMRFSPDGPRLIEVSFYPEEKWWISDVDVSGQRRGERRPLTPSEYAETEPLRL